MFHDISLASRNEQRILPNIIKTPESINIQRITSNNKYPKPTHTNPLVNCYNSIIHSNQNHCIISALETSIFNLE